jgi:hypothetical protein
VRQREIQTLWMPPIRDREDHCSLNSAKITSWVRTLSASPCANTSRSSSVNAPTGSSFFAAVAFFFFVGMTAAGPRESARASVSRSPEFQKEVISFRGAERRKKQIPKTVCPCGSSDFLFWKGD